MYNILNVWDRLQLNNIIIMEGIKLQNLILNECLQNVIFLKTPRASFYIYKVDSTFVLKTHEHAIKN